MRKDRNVSVYLSYLLRHKPQDAGLHMDHHGWVEVEELIAGVNAAGQYTLDRQQLEQIVAACPKQRYRFDDTGRRIKACQGHSIPWVEPELTYGEPPARLFHGTTDTAYRKILETGHISRMKRHGVHMSADVEKAWASAQRWHHQPVVLVIDAERMYREGFSFGESDNHVWLTEEVPVRFICDVLYREAEE